MDNSLDSILSEEPADNVQAAEQQQTAAETQVEQQEATDTETDKGTGEEAGTPPETQKDDPLEKHRKGLEAAAAAERKRRQEAEARATQAEAELRALREEAKRLFPTQQPTHQQPDADPKPQRAQYESEDEWLDARDAWRDRQRTREEAETKAQREAQDMFVKTESIYAQAQALEGFSRAVFDALPLSKPIVEALIDSDNAPALMHYMAANPAEVQRIAGLPTARQIKEMARIEDKLVAAPEKEEQTPPAKEKPQLPETLTQARNAKGQFEPAYSGPTPLNAVLASK